MTDELVAYLLDDLGPERRAEIERRLETDAEWRQEFNRLRECFATSGDPAECIEGDAAETDAHVEPPQDLVKRTCCYVERACETKPAPRRAAAFVAAPTAGVGGTSAPWSMADLTVGGGVLLVLGMLVLPALQESRNAARRLTCEDNLRALGTGLFQYQETHGGWVPPVGPGESAAQYAPALADPRVGFTREELAPMLVCPDSPEAEWITNLTAADRVPTYDQLDANVDSQDQQASAKQPWVGYYAYEIGYWDQRNQYHYVKYTGASHRALLADAPELSPTGVLRSSSHGGNGQYVLDQSLCVKYRMNCDLARGLDNIYLNRSGEPDAGFDSGDNVLIRPDARPSAPIMWINGAWTLAPR